MPCPKSHFPVYPVMTASALTANHESSFSGSMWEGCVPKVPWPCLDSHLHDPELKLTIRAPPFCRNSRRECVMLVLPRHTFEWPATCERARSSGTERHPRRP